jgi:hypothetical protein
MAFNPFHRFRKHQRAILAVVTIMLMLVFGLTWGMGDVTTRLFGGAPKGAGPLATTFKFGSGTFSTQTKVYEKDVSDQMRRRRLVNDFILNVVAPLSKDAIDKLSPPFDRNNFNFNRPVKYPPELADFFRSRDIRGMLNLSPQQLLQQIQQDIERVAELRQKPPSTVRENETKTQEFLRACDVLIGSLRLDLWQIERYLKSLEAGPNANLTRDNFLYFGGTTSLDDTLDFMLWKHQADRLRITYTPNDVCKALNRLIGAGDEFPPNGSLLDNTYASQWIRQTYKHQENYIDPLVKELTDALADEFRVQTAQASMVGQPSGGPSSFFVPTGIYQPTQTVTPDEFLQYVRKQRTSLKLAVLDVPVKNFVDPNEQVSEKELRDLYEKGRSVEPAPDRPTMGFKVPRKVRVEYATANPESEHFKNMAKVTLAIRQPVLSTGGLASVFAASGDVAWVSMAAAPLLVDPLDQEYRKYQQNYQQDEDRQVVLKQPVSTAFYDPHYRAAATVGDVLGSLQQSGPLSVPTTIAGSHALHDTVAAQAGGAVMLVATNPSPLTLGSLTAYPALHTIHTRKQMEPVLREQMEKAVAERQVAENLNTLSAELEKIINTSKENEKVEKANAYLETARKELGLEINGMSAAKDRYGLADDPAMKYFKEEYDQLKAKRPNERIVDFAELFLMHRGVYRAQPDPLAGANLEPHPKQYVIWLAEDKPAHEVPFDEVRADVLAAQRFSNARTRALAYVLKLLDPQLKERKDKWPPDFQTREKEIKSFLAEQKEGRVFELDNVCRLWTPEQQPNQTAAERPYYAYKPPENEFPYPPASLVERLMTLNNPGDALFLRDRPEKNFYVAVLLERSVPSLDDFRKVYEKADASMLRDPLWDNCVREQRQEFHKQFIRQMREEWTGELDDKGRIKVPDDVRGKFDKSGGES